MSRFLDDANGILQAAASVSDASPELTILIHRSGQIHMIDGAASPMEALLSEYGCGAAFRVTRQAGNVRVEGRKGAARCILETARSDLHSPSAASALGVFRDRPLYSVAGTLALS